MIAGAGARAGGDGVWLGQTNPEKRADDCPFSGKRGVELGLGTDSRLKEKSILLDVHMEKYSDRHWQARGWQPRRVVLTEDAIFFFKQGSPQIVDLIPVLEISQVALEHSHLAHTTSSRYEQTSSSANGANMLTDIKRRGDKFIHRMEADLNGKELSMAGLDKALMKASLNHTTSTPQASSSPHEFIAKDSSQIAEEQECRHIAITTAADSPFGGTIYMLRCSDENQANEWVRLVRKCREKEYEKYRWSFSKNLVQRRLQKVYGHKYCQSLVAALILGNFASSMVELQLRGSHQEIFKSLDVAFTVVFLVELLMNMLCHWFWEFWGSAFNVFDFIVVVVTTISLLPYFDLKVISILRLLRAFRVVRIFGRLGSARRIIIALASSIGPVLNVLIVVTGTIAVFAMFGATAYPDAPRFYTFGDAMYTMFLTLCLDGWSDLVDGTEEYYPPSTAAMPPKLYFIAYIFVVVFILMPVFVAAILDGYRTSAYQQTRADAKNRGAKAIEEHVPQFSYDAVLHGLLTCFNKQQLDNRLQTIFQVLDTDESGSVSFEEMRLGLHKIASSFSKSYLTHDEFEALAKNGEYLDDDGGMDFYHFSLAMNEQLRGYSMRKLCQYMVAMGEDEPGYEIMMFALKILLTDIESHSINRRAGQDEEQSLARTSEEVEVTTLTSTQRALESDPCQLAIDSADSLADDGQKPRPPDHAEEAIISEGSVLQASCSDPKVRPQNKVCDHCGLSSTYALLLGEKIDAVLARLVTEEPVVCRPSPHTNRAVTSLEASSRSVAIQLSGAKVGTHLQKCEGQIDGLRSPDTPTWMLSTSDMNRESLPQSTAPHKSLPKLSSEKYRKRKDKKGRAGEERGQKRMHEQDSDGASDGRKSFALMNKDDSSNVQNAGFRVAGLQESPGLPSLQLGFSRPQ